MGCGAGGLGVVSNSGMLSWKGATVRKPDVVIAKLDAFLRAGDRGIPEHAGSISTKEAKRKAELESDPKNGRSNREIRQIR